MINRRNEKIIKINSLFKKIKEEEIAKKYFEILKASFSNLENEE